MNAVMEIQGTRLQIKEYNGQRVVTFKDIDTVHKRPDGTARKRFADNRKRFIDGIDYYRLSKEEIQLSEIRTVDTASNNGVTLITESGYLMLVKSFTDDLAWKVQRELVDTYFRVRTSSAQTVTVTETSAEMYMEASRIMAGCLKHNTPYVLNILRHIIPDVGHVDAAPVEKKVTEVTVKEERKQNRTTNLGVPIDIPKMLEEMGNQNISVETLADRANVSPITISNWIAGKHQPVLQNRINVCVALGKDKDFLTPKRRRKVKP